MSPSYKLSARLYRSRSYQHFCAVFVL